jgi:uncharacterized protein YndB with AHSA1/START domain
MHEVERETVVPGTPAEAWRAVVESDWLGEDVRIDPRPDGEVDVREPDGEMDVREPSGKEGRARRGFVEDADPPHRLVFWWSRPGEDATRVEIALDEVDGGTRVRVVESRPLAILDASRGNLGSAIGIHGPQALAAV